MSALKLRDRDAIVTQEGFIFRVFGYSHPKDAYICDAEYASSDIFQSTDPRALRSGEDKIYYKFYDDEAWKFISKNYPKYFIHHDMLDKDLIGVKKADIAKTRIPQKRLQEMALAEPNDKLHVATLRVLATVLRKSGLQSEDLGVFGSMLHNFHHPDYSDIDLLIYGKEQNAKIREALGSLYEEKNSGFTNEFDTDVAIRGKKWRFHNFSSKEYLWHQKRKLIYGLYYDDESKRTIKSEFEPVKDWCEIFNEYNSETQIVRKDWVKVKAKVIADSDGPFIPSVYGIEPIEVLKGSKDALEAVRIISYMEEFRMQAKQGERVLVEGNLEKVITRTNVFHQITLSYGPRYYEQTLKVIKD